MFMESWILQVSCKVSEALFRVHVNFARDLKYSWFHKQTKKMFISYIYILLNI